MKIAFVMYQGSMWSGGQGVYLRYVTGELARMGHEVHVISGRPYPHLEEGVIHHRLKTFSFWAFLEGRDELAYHDNVWEFFHPLNFWEFASTRVSFASLLNTFSFRAYRKLADLERATGPFDLVHDNQTLGYGVALMKAARPERPVVANIHHPLQIDRANSIREAHSLGGVVSRLLWYPDRMQPWVARRLDRIITGSENSRDSVSEVMGIPKDRIVVIYDGVDTDVFRPLPDVEKVPGLIVFAGNAEDRNKGARYLLDALARLQAEVDFRLVMVGRKEKDLSWVPGEVWRLGLRRMVEYSGFLSTEDLVRLLNRAHLLVSPSLYEGFGLPACEAGACGTAVVATTAGALPEVVEDGVTGLLVPPGDADALACAIKTLLQDFPRARAMGEAGRKRVERLFTWRECARKTEALYRQLVSAAATPETAAAVERGSRPQS